VSASPDDESRAGVPIALVERTLDRVADWTRFGDAKAGGVLVLLALGLADLLSNASRLSVAHRLSDRWGDAATGLFWLALVLAVLVVIQVSRALFPKVEPSKKSVFFFGSVAKYEGGDPYAAELKSMSDSETLDHLASQVWELSRIATRKFKRARIAYWLVLAFLGAWAVARLSLALAAEESLQLAVS
jgi:Family of unknown function (DUF5706)